MINNDLVNLLKLPLQAISLILQSYFETTTRLTQSITASSISYIFCYYLSTTLINISSVASQTGQRYPLGNSTSSIR